MKEQDRDFLAEDQAADREYDAEMEHQEALNAAFEADMERRHAS